MPGMISRINTFIKTWKPGLNFLKFVLTAKYSVRHTVAFRDQEWLSSFPPNGLDKCVTHSIAAVSVPLSLSSATHRAAHRYGTPSTSQGSPIRIYCARKINLIRESHQPTLRPAVRLVGVEDRPSFPTSLLCTGRLLPFSR